mgnify:CR=1 FL=1
MKKIIAAMIALAAVSSAAYASPLTTYQKGQTEINVGMWDVSAKSNGYKSDGEWNFTGGLASMTNGLLSTSTQAFPPTTPAEI